MYRLILVFVVMLLYSDGSFAQSVCTNLNSGGTAIVGDPFPVSSNNDCSQYPAGTVLLNISDPKYTAWAAVRGPAGIIAKTTAAAAAVANALSAGITLSCSASDTNNMSGTYSLSPDLLRFLLGVQLVSAAQLQSFIITDSSGTAHQFKDAPAAATIAGIMLGYSMQLFSYQQAIAAGQKATLPPNTSSSC